MEVAYFNNSHERTVMLYRGDLDELPPTDRIAIILEGRLYLEEFDLKFLVDEVSNPEEQKFWAKRIQNAKIPLSEGARKLLDDILAQE